MKTIKRGIITITTNDKTGVQKRSSLCAHSPKSKHIIAADKMATKLQKPSLGVYRGPLSTLLSGPIIILWFSINIGGGSEEDSLGTVNIFIDSKKFSLLGPRPRADALEIQIFPLPFHFIPRHGPLIINVFSCSFQRSVSSSIFIRYVLAENNFL